MIRREDDLQFFSAVRCMHLESKDAESLVMTYLEACQPGTREICNDCSPKVRLREYFVRDYRLGVRLKN